MLQHPLLVRAVGLSCTGGWVKLTYWELYEGEILATGLPNFFVG